MSRQSDAAVDRLLTQFGAPSDYMPGTCFITEPVVCESNAGYYVGTWCIEAIGAQWLPQPNSRDSGYMSESEAARLLSSWSE